MSRVPDTDTFSLSEVRDVIDDDPATAAVTSVTDNGGVARFNTSNTKGLDPGDMISLTGFTSYNGVYAVTALSTNSWIETIQGYSGDESGIWTATLLKTLIDCFDNAIAARFDPRYEGSKDRQSNFRNYGWIGNLTHLETDDDGGTYRGLDGKAGEGFIVVCRYASGVSTYNVSGVQELALLDTQVVKYTYDAGNSDTLNCWRQDDWVFVVGTYSSTSSTLFSVPVDYLGDLTVQDDEYHFSGSDDRIEWITGDGSKFLFVATQSFSDYPKIHTFSYDSNGDFILEDTYDFGYLGGNIYDMWYAYWNSIHFLFVATSAGVYSFSINQTTGELTLIEADTIGTGFHGIIGDKDKQLLFVSYTTGIAVFSVSNTGYMTLEDLDALFTTGGARVAYNGIFIFVIGFNTNDRVYIYRLDENIDLVYEGIEVIADADDVYCYWDNDPDRLYVTRLGYGISVYSID